MIIDTSAVLAVLFAEDDAARYASAVAGAEVRLMSAANCIEAASIIDNQIGPMAGRQFDAFISRADIRVEAVTRAQADIARQAYISTTERAIIRRG